MEGLRPAFAGRIGLSASSGGTLEKADVLGPGRAGHRAVGAEGGWGGTNFLHNPWPLKMQSECHGRTPDRASETVRGSDVGGQKRSFRLRNDVVECDAADDRETGEHAQVAVHAEVPAEHGLVAVAEVRDVLRRRIRVDLVAADSA